MVQTFIASGDASLFCGSRAPLKNLIACGYYVHSYIAKAMFVHCYVSVTLSTLGQMANIAFHISITAF